MWVLLSPITQYTGWDSDFIVLDARYWEILWPVDLEMSDFRTSVSGPLFYSGSWFGDAKPVGLRRSVIALRT